MGRTSDARARLVAAMAELVHRSGYSAVSVDDICAAAKVKKGSFYYFFRSKRELMLAVLDMRWGSARDHFGAIFAKEVPPLERIERFFAVVGDMEAKAKKSGGRVLGCPFGNVAAEMASSEPVLGKRVDDVFCGLREVFREVLDDAVAAGDVEAGVNTQQAAEAIVAYFEGVSLVAKARNDPSMMVRLGALATRLAITEAQRSGSSSKKTDAAAKKNGPRRAPRPVRARRNPSR